MKNFRSKYFIFIFFALILFSCRSKKNFNGTAELPCPDFDGVKIEEKKKSKWRLVLYKDGRRVFGKKRRGKTKLFKK